MKILIVGGAGYVGGAVTDLLLKDSNNEINSNDVLENISNCMATKITRIPIRPETPKGSFTVSLPNRYLYNCQ